MGFCTRAIESVRTLVYVLCLTAPRASLVVVVLATVLVGATTAGARPPELPKQVGGPHVLVHYDPAVTSDAAAKSVLDAAETAWTTEVGQWGFTQPPVDGGLGGDDRTDIYLMTPEEGSEGGFATTDDELDNGGGFIELDPKFARGAFVAHELFHLIQYGYLTGDRPFLYEATAEWAAANIFPTADLSKPLFLTHPEGSLDCDPVASCAGDVGYGQWPFFQYVSERYGPQTVRAIWEQYSQLDGEGSQALPAIAAALAAQGGSLADAWNGYVRENLTPGAYANPLLKALKASTPASQPLGLSARAMTGAATLRIDHLAARYLSIKAACTKKKRKAKQLKITVQLPAGSASAPALRLAAPGEAPSVTPLTVSGTTDTAAVPFANCATAILAIPNPSATADGASFTVTVSAR